MKKERGFIQVPPEKMEDSCLKGHPHLSVQAGGLQGGESKQNEEIRDHWQGEAVDLHTGSSLVPAWTFHVSTLALLGAGRFLDKQGPALLVLPFVGQEAASL